MFLCCWLALLAFIPATSSVNPGVKVRVTSKGLEYGRQLGMLSIQHKLKNIKIPDVSGKKRVSPIGKVRYSFTNMNVLNVGLPKSSVELVAGSGIKLSIGDASLSMRGNWRVKYLRFIKNSGSFDLNVNGISITSTIAMKNDPTGRPVVSVANCAASVASAKIKFRGGASWLYNLFRKFISKAIRSQMQKQLCPRVTDAVSDMNPQLKTLNVVAKVDKYAEIEYSMVAPPAVSKSFLDLSLKGEFYNIGKHQEPPFTPSVFALPPQANNMLYIGLSSFSTNSAAFVYNKAGALSLYITDDMIPQSSPIRLNTRTFGALIPQIAKSFPGLMIKLLVKTSKDPVVTFEPDNMTIQAVGTVTAYAIQPNATLSPLFVLNLDTSVSARVFVSGTRLAGAVSLNKMSLTLGTSYVGQFQVRSLDSILQLVLRAVVIPRLNVQLAKGYPLPSLGKMKLMKTQLKVVKDYMLIGTDVQFSA